MLVVWRTDPSLRIPLCPGPLFHLAEAAVARQRKNVADSQHQAETQLTAIAEEKQHIRELVCDAFEL